ncbi:MAG: site-specific DNA-methyltransferase [Actinobacteria bacterium]|nr:site-specific DNA-methyltransferase [Actinomycetota bacterium]
MSPNSVDITITSPPYNLGKSIQHGKELYDQYNDYKKIDDYQSWLIEVLEALLRVTKYYIFFNIQILQSNKRAVESVRWYFRNNRKDTIIWVKNNPPPMVQSYAMCRGWEYVDIYCSEERAKKITFEHCNFDAKEKGTYIVNTIRGNTATSEKKLWNIKNHFAIFPYYLAGFIILNFARPGDTIFDPFVGTGTTCQVAKDYGLNYIGFDISENYIRKANQRLAQESMKL